MIKKDLLSRQCSPATEKSPRLSQSEISRYLTEVAGWSQKGVTIQKSYVFKDFKNAISFVNQVAEVAEKEDHHPDIEIYYNKIILTLWTHVVKGLTENDFILAAKIEAIP